MEVKEELSYLDFSTVGLFILMGIFHVIAPMLFGTSTFAFGLFIFGMLYTSLGLLIHKHPDNKKIGIASFLVPIIGMMLAIFSLLNDFNGYIFFLCLRTPVLDYAYLELIYRDRENG